VIQWHATTAYVTGASRGIGEAVARALHNKGATVGLIARSTDDLERLSRSLGARVAIASADVADRAQIGTAIDALADVIGPPDVLVNNAGVGSYAAFVDEDPEAFERLMRVNYLGTVYATRGVLPGMLERAHGHIVNVASIAGVLGAPYETAYSASKFAVVGISEALAAEVKSQGVSVSLVSPGPVRTHFTEARGVEFQRRRPKPLRAQQVAEAVLNAVERDRFEQILPRWLRWPGVVRLVAPQAYRAGVVRDTDARRP
jgi:3-oxoacyl-[acyl-carrier protein] reductase